LLHERLFSDKSVRLCSQSSNDQFQRLVGASNKGLMLGSPKEPSIEDKVDQTIGNKDMEVHQQKSFSTPSLNIKDPCSEKFAEKVNRGLGKNCQLRLWLIRPWAKEYEITGTEVLLSYTNKSPTSFLQQKWSMFRRVP
uniref:Uncharacterized protein n=2 Tax=Aegilops tauschii subsp. strangulata TaxID=200361 RepID=A0A453HD86_AEGTS